MPNEQHTWETGETITAEKLNNLEERAGGGVFVCHGTIDWENEDPLSHEYPVTIEESAEELLNAVDSDIPIVVLVQDHDTGTKSWHFAKQYLADEETGELSLTFEMGPNISSNMIESWCISIRLNNNQITGAYASSVQFLRNVNA